MRHAISICWAALVLGVLLKLGHFPFASVTLVLSLSILSILYFMPGTSVLVQPEVVLDKLETLAVNMGRMALALAPVGALFTIQHWPNGSTFLILGAVGCSATLSLLWYLRGRYHELEDHYTRSMVHLAMNLALVLGTYLYYTQATTAMSLH